MVQRQWCGKGEDLTVVWLERDSIIDLHQNQKSDVPETSFGEIDNKTSFEAGMNAANEKARRS